MNTYDVMNILKDIKQVWKSNKINKNNWKVITTRARPKQYINLEAAVPRCSSILLRKKFLYSEFFWLVVSHIIQPECGKIWI